MLTIDERDLEMCRWARNYLTKNSKVAVKTQWWTDYQATMAILNSQPNEDARQILLIKMADAWRQKQYRDRQKSRGKKPCSFILSATTWDNLIVLATEEQKPLNEMLEKIINQAHSSLIKRKERKNAKHFVGTAFNRSPNNPVKL